MTATEIGYPTMAGQLYRCPVTTRLYRELGGRL